MNLEISRVLEKDKAVLRRLLELNSYDFSEFNREDLNEHGLFDYEYLDNYFTENERYAFFIKVEGKYAGFVMLNKYCFVLKDENARAVSEFFILRKYRRLGIGRKAAKYVFDMFPSKWELRQHENNDAARIFWEKVIGEYTGGKYEKVVARKGDSWTGQVLIFQNIEK